MMASREVVTAVEDFNAIVSENNTLPSLSADDDASQIVDQLARVSLSEKGLQDLATIISVITEESDGFCALLQTAAGANFPSTVSEGLTFLADLLKAVRHEKTLRQYVLLGLRPIWDCAFAVWKLSSAAKVRACAADLLSEVTDVAAAADKINDLNVAPVLTSLLGEARRHVGKSNMGVTVKQPLYSFFGTIARRAPMFATDHVDSIFAICLSEIQKEMKDKDPKFAVIAGSLEGISGLMHNFSSVPKCTNNMDVIFSTCRKVIRVTDVSRYAMIFAALKLLAAHMAKFVKNLMADKTTYSEMYEDLKRWATHPSNVESRKLGFAALTEFLKQVSRSIVMHLENKTNMETCNAAFSFFIGEFNEKIKNADNPREMTVAVRGYGYFVLPCRMLSSPDQMKVMLHEMLQKSEQTFYSAATGFVEISRLEHLPIFIDTLASIVQDGGTALPEAFLSAIQRLCGLILEFFPKLAPAVQHSGAQVIIKTVMIVTRVCPEAKDFLADLLFEGLKKACSFKIPPENLPEPVLSSDGAPVFKALSITYKDYLLLWNKLCGCEYMKDLVLELNASEMDLYNTAKILFVTFINSALRLMDGMNFQLMDTGVDEEKVSVDLMALDKIPMKESDLEMFFQLEQIVTDVLQRANLEFVMELDHFCLETIKLAQKNPLISGLYRLVEAFFRRNIKAVQRTSLDIQDVEMETNDTDDKMDIDHPGRLSGDRTDVLQRNRLIILSFMRDLLGHLQHFSGEILISALQLLLCFPIYAVEENLSTMMDAVVLALQTGKSYLPLTETTIAALRRYCFSGELDASLVHPYFSTILPELDNYLRSTTLKVVARSEVARAVGKTRRKKPVASVVTDEAALTRVRDVILDFLGELGGKHNHLILDADWLSDVKSLAIVWDMVQHLQFPFPFPDMMLSNFYLDSFLPRVTDLCLQSPDRPTKVAACELLHAVTVFLVGTHSEMPAEKRDKSTLMDLITKLFPKILELACDTEPVTKQIFEPLVVQMVHWYSRNASKASAEAYTILGCIMDGLVSERNPAMRVFCARCLWEFLEWSGKNFPGDQKNVPAAAAALLERIVSYAGHPSATKRFGAALAFNHCYKTFRENSAIVDVFTLDLIVTFTKSSALCHRDPPGFGSVKVVELSLTHLTRIVEKYAKTFMKASSRRRKPADLAEPTLQSLTDWLLLQACRPETACRMSSWRLVERLLTVLDGSQSAGYFLTDVEKRHGRNWLLKAFLCGGFDPDDSDGHILKVTQISLEDVTDDNVQAVKKGMDHLGAVVDCYTLAIGKIYIKFETIISSGSAVPEWGLFRELVAGFIGSLSAVTRSSPTGGLAISTILRPGICSILVRITDFIIACAKYGKDGAAAIAFLATEQFMEIIVHVIVDPASFGFDTRDMDVKNHLLPQMKTLLRTLMGGEVGVTGWGKLVPKVVDAVLRTSDYDLVERLSQNRIDNLESLISGFAVLHELDLDKGYLRSKRMNSEEFAKSVYDFIQSRLRTKHSTSGSRREVWIAVDATLEKAFFSLVLLCSNDTMAVVDRCISTAENRTILYVKLRSAFFRHIFSDSVKESAVRRQEVFFETLVGKKANQSVDGDKWTCHLSVVKDTMDFLSRNRVLKKRYGAGVVRTVLDLYGSFIEQCPVEIRRNVETVRSIISLMRLLLHADSEALKRKTAEIRLLYNFYVRILSEPVSSDLQCAATKNRALEWLSPFLMGSESSMAEKALENIYINDLPLKAAELSTVSPRYAFYLETVKRILLAAEKSRNIAAIEICMKLICRGGNHPLLDDFQATFEKVVTNDHSEAVQKIFDIPWKIFMNPQYAPEHRRAAIEKILLPMIRAATLTAQIDFFSRTIKEIMELSEAKERFTTVSSLTVQTCCFNLLEVMCATLPKSELTTITSKIVMAFCESPVTGREVIAAISKTVNTYAHENVASEPGMEEVRRLFHCAAYRALVAAVTATQTDLKFYYSLLFEELPDKGKLLWRNLIDLNAVYTFEVEFVQAPKKKSQLAAIHKEVTADTNGSASSLSSGIFTATSYASARVSSASLIETSSFSEDLARYDFSGGLDRTAAPLMKNDAARCVELEVDKLNQHECMPTLVALLRHMIDQKITPASADPLPNWISALRKELQTGPLNVKLFLAKLIVNMENDATKPGFFIWFAHFLYGPLLDLVVEVDCADGLNYFVVDLLHLMLTWSVKMPVGLEDKFRVQRAFQFVIQHVKHTNTRVQKNNLTLLKVMCEAWKSHLECPPTGIIPRLLINDRANAKQNIPVINIIAIVLNAGLPFTIAGFEEFRKILQLHMQEASKPLYTVAALTMGLLFSRASDLGLAPAKIEPAVEDAGKLISSMADKEKDKFVALLHQISKSYAGILPSFISRIMFLIPTLPANIKANGLDVLLAGAEFIADPYTSLEACGIYSCVNDSNERVQGLTLELLQKIAPRMITSQFQELLPHLTSFSSHSSPLLREQYYKLCMWLYEHFEDSKKPEEQSVLQTVRERLFTGLKDQDKTIKSQLTAFWSNEKRMSGSTFQRLITIFTNFVTSELETSFLPIACHLLLDQSEKSPIFSQLLFRNALTDCEFFRQEIATSYKQRSSMAPVTTSTFPSATFSGTYGATQSSQKAPVFTPTQAPQGPSQDTQRDGPAFTYSSQLSQSLIVDLGSGYGYTQGIASTHSTQDEHTREISRGQRELNAIKRRFQRDSNDQSSRSFFARREMNKKKQQEETLKNERERQSLDVTLSRDYRIGDVPDIQIPYSAIIRPLQILAEHDMQTSSLLLRHVFGGIIAQARTKSEDVGEGLDILAKKLHSVLSSYDVMDPTFISALLNILVHDTPKESKLLEAVPSSAITSSALKSNQPNLGIAVLEQGILLQSSEPDRKRSRQRKTATSEQWLGIYQLLRSDEQTDSIIGLQLDTVFQDADAVMTATKMEARGDYFSAATIYGTLRNSATEDKLASEVLQESYMQCLDELGRWDYLQLAAVPSSSEDPESKQCGDLNCLWDDPRWVTTLMPFAIRATLNLSFANNDAATQQFEKFVKDAMNKDTLGRKNFLLRKFGLEIALYHFFIGNNSEALYYLNNHAAKNFLEDWSGTTQLNQHSRRKLLPVVQLIEEGRRFAQVLHQIDHAKHRGKPLAVEFLSFLADSGREPYANDPVGVWNDLVTNRCNYADVLGQNKETHLSASFASSFGVHEMLRVVKTAIRQNNFAMCDRVLMLTDRAARQQFSDSEEFSEPDSLRRLEDRWSSVYAQVTVARSRFYPGPEQAASNLQKLVKSLKLIERLIDSSRPESTVTLRAVCAEIQLSIADILRDHHTSVEMKPEDLKHLGLTNARSVTPLYSRVFAGLTEACEKNTGALAFLRTFQYCDQLIGKNILDDGVLVSTGTSVLLQAIKLGNVEARDLFCRVLVWLREYTDIVDVFQRGCAVIPTWMFLSWSNQMLALLDKPEGRAVHDILIRLAKDYPQAMIYGFKMSSENYVFAENEESSKQNKACFKQLAVILANPLIDEFVLHLTRLCEPHIFFADFANRAEYLLKNKKKGQLKAEYADICKKVFEDGSGNSLGQSWKAFVAMFEKKFAAIFGPNGSKINNMSMSQFKPAKDKLQTALTEHGKKLPFVSKSRLADLNPWLAKFSSLTYGSVLEIPGQYDGREKPRPERHVKISSFGDEVRTLVSLRRPRRLIIRGDDEQDYPFLVKGGEDLRLDQRIEQLFVLMNRVFSQNSDCAKRHLHIRTYKVVPMTTQVGIIEWVKGSTTLKDFLDKGQPSLDDALGTARTDRYALMKKAMKISEKKLYGPAIDRELNTQAFTDISATEMRKIFQTISRPIDPHRLRRQLQRLTVSPDAFVVVRNLFAQAYGVMSIGQYVLGIGDRHLSNCMVSTETGLIFPIDFGHAFGSSVQSLPIPEMAPLRLTRQFVHLMAPFGIKGLLEQTMIHTMTALRKERQILLATMDVFIQEPSMDWLQAARKYSATDTASQIELTWYPREKIKIAERKLLGANPAFITRDELRRGHFEKNKPVVTKQEEICIGEADGIRAVYGDQMLSVEAQVECLIDMSTDENILGRFYWGWNPWV